jgi:hypothetical protein
MAWISNAKNLNFKKKHLNHLNPKHLFQKVKFLFKIGIQNTNILMLDMYFLIVAKISYEMHKDTSFYFI